MKEQKNRRILPDDHTLYEHLKSTITEFYYAENHEYPNNMSIGNMLFSLNSIHTAMIKNGWSLGSEESVEQFLERIE
ncbi:hypothetical protein [Levilactobacillus angrenensis]|uniref:Uncharacterized protein n=1 Tax=Levilactobacillus angrenensis TaxID=2486020 RepID=A0ABW1U7J1_9LACO|nr:hypothetical protein [Levilactobacillus angrenensis]